jgi:HTH-type transcriptional regulator / antitoxin HigA
MSPSAARQFTPAWSLHPGVILRHKLEERDIRQSELAERTGLTAKHVNQIINGAIGISGDVALLLDRALGVSAEFWTRADAEYQAQASREQARTQLPKLSEWASRFDLVTLRRNGITTPGDSQGAKVESILRFFGVASPEAFERTWLQPRVSFRRSQSFTVDEPNTALWLRLVERSAESVTVPTLRPGALRRVARTIPAMTNHTVPDGFTVARGALAEAGVVLTFVRQVPETRVSGATWWLGSERPVIGLTERLRKPDCFWFNLLHEIGHILLHPRRTTFLDLEMDKQTKDPAESEAHAFAEATLMSDEARSLVAKASTRHDLLSLATRFGVGVSIVAGHHGYTTGRWNIGGSLRGTITEDDIHELEEISGTGHPQAQGEPDGVGS